MQFEYFRGPYVRCETAAEICCFPEGDVSGSWVNSRREEKSGELIRLVDAGYASKWQESSEELLSILRAAFDSGKIAGKAIAG